EENPNQIVCRKMEHIVERMQDEQAGVPVRTVKSFMSKIPSVFTGERSIAIFLLRGLGTCVFPAEALHLAHLMSSHGYFFPIDDHMLTVKADGTFYRFQTPYFWPSNCWEPENTDYGESSRRNFLRNRVKRRHGHFFKSHLATPEHFLFFFFFCRFFFFYGCRVDKKRDKLERKVLDSQERAFWDVHRPVPGCVNTTEIDIKKACRMNKPIKSAKHMQCAVPGGRISPSVSEGDLNAPLEALKQEIEKLKSRLDRRNVKISKVSESYLSYFEQYQEYDPFISTPEPSNPWISDSTDFWELEKQTKDIPARRVRRWAFSMKELFRDPAGREQFFHFLEKEFSAENLKFWDAVQELKQVHSKDVPIKVQEIWNEYLGTDANCPINIDSKSYEITKRNMENPDRWTFEEAAV
ncbi:regulator of G protein signaling, putative, partial [Ixodes scapularis]